tara:strand:+ start:142 stop:843 length:702 start_codon:yes stop_codon:yes gene_type:complete
MKFKHKDLISVVMLAKNERQSIEANKLCEKILEYTNDFIVMDGDSTDNTKKFCSKFTDNVFVDGGNGKGTAIRNSLDHVKNKITVFIDADGSHDPHDIPKLVDPIIKDNYDHVQGSRTRGGSDEYFGNFDKLLRVTGSHIILILINKYFDITLTDSQNGFRAIKSDVFRKLNTKEKITTIEQEVIIKTLKKGFSLHEVPTHEYQRTHGESKIKLRLVFFRYIYSVLKYLYFSK